MKIPAFALLLLAVLLFLPLPSTSYPIDGYDFSGIRRLVRLQLILEGEIKDTKPIPGAQKSIDDIKLNLLGERGEGLDSLPAPDPGLQKALNGLFPNLHESYSVTLLDITEGKPVRYAQRQPNRGFQPGSVGKLAVAAGLFCELENLYPDSFELRRELLKTRLVRGGPWAVYDEHTVPFFDPETKKFFKRQVQENDVFSLYEWADHMLSVSNNGAAAVVWREVILMRVFGEKYPELTEAEAEEYFRKTPKSELSELAISVVNDPLRDLGISEEEWRLGKMFTRGASNIIPPKGGSTGSPAGLMKYLIAVERGKLIDEASSLEVKRLMYMTDRRIRYAASPALTDAAVYFKSGSLYKCKPEEGYECGKYKGNVDNFMNSVAIIEHPDGPAYMVALMSNVLKKNSNIDHNALASRIDKIVRN
ncbi:MAG: serine hydrolase [Lewinellaceae bacterium]|nr:serine hydrolase [Lewinellaceae bacterium]MCB9291421.1 serine hydrolase [Lewinellaceae bacterium]